jgi:hypothetical protein
VSILAGSLKLQFSQIMDFLLPTVLKLTTRANKVYVSSATLTLKTCIKNAGCVPFISNLAEGLQSQSKSQKIASMECILEILQGNQREDLQTKVQEVEFVIAIGIVDSFSEVRDLCRKVFESYRTTFAERVEKFVSTLPDTARRYLKLEKTKSMRSINSTEFLKAVRSKEFINDTHLDKPKVAMNAKRREESKEDIARSVEVIDVKPGRKMEAQRAEKSIGEETPKPTTLGGAKRIAKAHSDANRPKMQPAQRVVPTPAVNLHSKDVSTSTTSLDASIDSTPSPSPAKLNRSPSKTLIPHRASPIKPKPAFQDSSTKQRSADNVPMRSRSNSGSESLKALSSTSIPEKPDPTKYLRNKASIPGFKANAKPPKPAPLSRAASLTNMQVDIKSTDWSKRFAVFEALETQMKEAKDWDFKSSHSDKSIKLIVAGLVDGHFKVQQKTLDCILVLLEFPLMPLTVVDQILPRITAIGYNAHQKIRPTVTEKCHACVNSFLKNVPLSTVGQAIVNGLGSPSFTAKIRFGCIGFLSSLTDQDFQGLCFKPLSIIDLFSL